MQGNNSEKNETDKKQSPPLQIDPNCLQEALRTFFQPLKTDDPRLNFYTLYEKQATRYDTDDIKKYDDDLSNTLLFAGLLSAVSSLIAVDTYPKLQPYPNDQSALLLQAIFHTLNHSTTPNVPSAQDAPPKVIVVATTFLYASLIISLLAALVAMLGKQWLNRYLRHAGGSMVERCGDRQLKCDGLKKWHFHFVIEILPVMLQISLLLLVCGLCQCMFPINTIVAFTIVALTGLGVLFYVGLTLAGASSYSCPFQTPASVLLRSLWKIGPSLISAAQFGIGRVARCLRLTESNITSLLPTTGSPYIPQEINDWFEPGQLDKIQINNSHDARCVSWVIKNITDPEALDAAIQRAGTIRWFDDGIDVKPVYDIIVSTLYACFDSNGEMYSGSRDRAYYSGRAMVWIHVLATSKGSRRKYPLDSRYPKVTDLPDHDLNHLASFASSYGYFPIEDLFPIPGGVTVPHSQWVSNLLLHLSWASGLSPLLPFDDDLQFATDDASLPPSLRLNYILAYCNLLGFRIREEVLKIEDKSDRLKQTLHHVSGAIASIPNTPGINRQIVRVLLSALTKLENPPKYLTDMAYGWCPVIWETFGDWEGLFLLPLKIAFRDLPDHDSRLLELPPLEYHQDLVERVFRTDDHEAISDLLRGFTAPSQGPAYASLCSCLGHIVGLYHNPKIRPFSYRLQELVLHAADCIGSHGFDGAESEEFVELSNCLCSGLGMRQVLILTLIKTIQSQSHFPGRVQHFAIHVWKFLARHAIMGTTYMRSEMEPDRKITNSLAARGSTYMGDGVAYDQQATDSLLVAQEWKKLEYWLGVVWMTWDFTSPMFLQGPGAISKLKEDTSSLFGQDPDAISRLKRRMEVWSRQRGKDMPAPLRELIKVDAVSSPPPDGEGEGPPHLSSPAQPLPSVDGD